MIRGMDSARDERMRAVYEQLVSISRRGVTRNRATAAPLTVVQYTLLTFIASTAECRAIDIAKSLRLNRSTVSRQVADLELLGLIEVGAAGAGGGSRGQILHVSDRGRELLDDSRKANQLELARRLADWSDDEIDRLARGLERFNSVDDA
jgi:DNA-binding MarR family transcriptional regulator